MDTNQSTPAEGLPELTQEQFLALIANVGDPDPSFMACTGKHAFAIARAAYQLGADVELEACCEWVRDGNGLLNGFHKQADDMRADRRPKPPSLREQALEALNRQVCGRDRGTLRPEAMADADIIRRALEALPE